MQPPEFSCKSLTEVMMIVEARRPLEKLRHRITRLVMDGQYQD